MEQWGYNLWNCINRYAERTVTDVRILEAPSIGEQITMGKLHFYHREFYELEKNSKLGWEQEQMRFLREQRKAVEELRGLYDRARAEMAQAEADIFAIHAVLLEDAELTRRVLEMIHTEGVTAQYAVHTVSRRVMKTFKSMEDTYMQARASDIRDIMRRVILRLVNIHPDHSIKGQPVILVSKYILPSEVMEFDRRQILGIITTEDSVDSHTAQILRDFGIPALIGVPLTADMEGSTALMDGHTGLLYLEPTVELTERLRKKYERGGCPEYACL